MPRLPSRNENLAKALENGTKSAIKFISKTCISRFSNLVSQYFLDDLLSKKTNSTSEFDWDLMEYEFSANFSIAKAFNKVKIHVQNNWDVTNNYTWHFPKIIISYFLLK